MHHLSAGVRTVGPRRYVPYVTDVDTGEFVEDAPCRTQSEARNAALDLMERYRAQLDAAVTGREPITPADAPETSEALAELAARMRARVERLRPVVPVYVAGNFTIHAGRKIGTYASGSPRYAKLCGTSRRDRHDPAPARDDCAVSCKRCLAKLAG